MSLVSGLAIIKGHFNALDKLYARTGVNSYNAPPIGLIFEKMFGKSIYDYKMCRTDIPCGIYEIFRDFPITLITLIRPESKIGSDDGLIESGFYPSENLNPMFVHCVNESDIDINADMPTIRVYVESVYCVVKGIIMSSDLYNRLRFDEFSPYCVALKSAILYTVFSHVCDKYRFKNTEDYLYIFENIFDRELACEFDFEERSEIIESMIKSRTPMNLFDIYRIVTLSGKFTF